MPLSNRLSLSCHPLRPYGSPHLRPKSRAAPGWPPKRACGRSPNRRGKAWLPLSGGDVAQRQRGGGTLSAKLTERVFPRRAPQRPPCVKGAVSEADWGIDNPSVCPPGRHLPLHKGGFHWPRTACFPSKFRSSGGIIPRPPIAAAVRAAIRLRRSTEAWQ